MRTVLVILAALVTVAASAIAAPEPDPFFARWETFGAGHGLPADKITAVALDGPRVWVGTEEGLAMREDGRFHVFGEEDGLPFRVISALAVHPATGDVWIGTMGGLARWSGGRIDAFTQMDSGLANDVIYGVALAGDDVWIATAAGLNRLDPGAGEWEIFDTTNTLMHEPWCYAVSAHGQIVYTAVWGSGVLVWEPEERKFRVHRDPDGEMEIDLFRDDGLVHDVTSAVSHGGGTLWVGTYFGLSRYDGRRWRSYSAADSGLASDFINFVRAWEDGVWIATDQGLSRFSSETWHTWRARPGRLSDLEVTDAGGTTTATVVRGGPAGNMIVGIDLAPDGIWLATASGLSHGIFHTDTSALPPTGTGKGGTR